MREPGKRLLIGLNSLCAEGTPVLVLEMSRYWREHGIEPSVVTLADGPDDLGPEFRALGISVRTLRLSSTRKWRYLEMAHGIFRISREIRADAFLSMPLGWHAFMAAGARCAGVARTAAHVGNYPPHTAGIAFEKFRALVQAGRPVTDRLICCSDYVRYGVHEHFRVPLARLEMIYNGSPVHDIAARAEQARSGGSDARHRVGMVARLEVHKDQPTLIRAAASLASQGVNVNVQFVGEGSRRAEYQALIDSLGLTDCVQLLGTRRDIPELLGTFGVFVFSTTPDEGLGVALIEAMAARVPIVATDVGACREVLNHGELGRLVPPNDPDALAAAIQNVLSDRSQAAARAARAQSKALSVFTIEAMAQGYARCLGLVSRQSATSEAVCR